MAGQLQEHSAADSARKGRNRAKLRNFEEANRQYKREVMLDNNEWKNDVQVQDIEQDQVYQAMVNQWTEQDQQLDELFAKGDQKLEQAIIEMYENDYAGTQTGRTAGRLAGKGAKKLGQYKSNVLHNMMMAKDEMAMKAETTHMDASAKSRSIYEKIRFSPVHGHTPHAPELEAKPGMGGLILGLAASGLGSAIKADAFKAPDIGNKNIFTELKPGEGMGGLTGFESGFAENWNPTIGTPPSDLSGSQFFGSSAGKGGDLDFSQQNAFGNIL